MVILQVKIMHRIQLIPQIPSPAHLQFLIQHNLTINTLHRFSPPHQSTTINMINHEPFPSQLFESNADSKSVPDINNSPDILPSITSRPLSSWPKKLGGFITAKTNNSNSDLTEAKLREFNSRNAIMEDRYRSSSPYYKGLTDFSLDINREKHSPGRESRATSYVTASSKSSFMVRVQELGISCFNSRKNDTKSPQETVVLTKTTKNEKTVRFQSKNIKGTFVSPTVKKPLRERDSGLSPMLLPLSPPIASPPESLPYPLPKIAPPESLPYPVPSLSPPSDTRALQLSPPTPTSDTEALQLPPPPPPTHTPGKRETERKYEWADRYRPVLLEEFLCNREKALWLKDIVRNWQNTEEECGHFIFEGNAGVGKRTMIWALLREAFGPDKVEAREESKTFYLKGDAVRSILVNLMISPQHVEVNLSEIKGYEKHVIVELIKEKNKKVNGTALTCKQENCRAIILYDADKLSIDALSYIKWMLEKFKECNKVFFCCRDAKKLQHIMPLCRYVQLNEPSIEEITKVLEFIAEKEGIQLPHQLANKIASNSQNNLRQAIRSFEATWHSNGCTAILTEDQDIKTGWEDKIANIAKNVLEEQSPKQLYNIRGEIQNLIEHTVSPEFIFQTLKEELKKILHEQLQTEFDQLYDEYQYQKNHVHTKYLPYAHQEEDLGERQNDQRKNVQKFMRIEEFIARFMSWYQGLVVQNLVA